MGSKNSKSKANSAVKLETLAVREYKPQPGDVPTHYEYAVMSEMAYYPSDKQLDPEIWQRIGVSIESWKNRGWEYVANKEHAEYPGIVWVNHKTQQVVIAHRGKDGLFNMVYGIKNTVFDPSQLLEEQHYQGKTFTKKSIEAIQASGKIVSKKISDYSLSFTGHSFGGWTAILMAYEFYNEYQPRVIVFDAPGTEEMRKTLQPNSKDRTLKSIWKKLAITNYLSPPNLINTCDEHWGRLVQIFPETNLANYSKLERHLFYSHEQTGSIGMAAIRKAFDEQTGYPLLQKQVLDWPLVEWKQLEELTTGAARSPLAELVFHVSTWGVGFLIDFAIGGLEDVRHNGYIMLNFQNQYFGAHKYFDAVRHYQELANLTEEQRHQLKKVHKYDIENSNDKEILVRELHPDVQDFLSKFNQYGAVLNELNVLSEMESKYLFSYTINADENKLILDPGVSFISFMEVIYRLAYRYTVEDKYKNLKDELKGWETSSWITRVAHLTKRLENLENNDPTNDFLYKQLNISIKRQLQATYQALAMERLLKAESVSISDHYIDLDMADGHVYAQSIPKQLNKGGAADIAQSRKIATYQELSQSHAHIELSQLFVTNTKKLIVGRPGTGKSTLCKYIAQDYAQGKLWGDKFDWVFLIPLNKINRANYNKRTEPYSISDVIYQECFINQGISYSAWQDIWKYIRLDKNVKELYILDGYDEVVGLNHKDTMDLWRLVEHLLQQDNVILTSRPNHKLVMDKKWQTLEILGFNERHINSYINNYFSNESKLCEELESLFAKNIDLLSLAKIPLNLEMICAIWEHHKGSLDTRRLSQMTFLYEEMTFLLLSIYLAREHSVKTQLLNRKEVLENPYALNAMLHLKALAYETIKGNTQSIKGSDLKSDIRNDLSKTHFISSMSNGKNEDDVDYYFVHLTMQEYLAALYLRDHLLTNSSVKEFIRHHKLNPRYEVMLWFLAGSLKDDVGVVDAQLKTKRKVLFELLNQSLLNVINHNTPINPLSLKIRCLQEVGLPKDLEAITAKTEIALSRELEAAVNQGDELWLKTMLPHLQACPKFLESPTLQKCLLSLLKNNRYEVQLRTIRLLGQLGESFAKTKKSISSNTQEIHVKILSELNITSRSKNPLLKLITLISQIQLNFPQSFEEKQQKKKDLLTSFLNGILQPDHGLRVFAFQELKRLDEDAPEEGLAYELSYYLKVRLEEGLSELSNDARQVLFTAAINMIDKLELSQTILLDTLDRLFDATHAEQIANTYLLEKDKLSSETKGKLMQLLEAKAKSYLLNNQNSFSSKIQMLISLFKISHQRDAIQHDESFWIEFITEILSAEHPHAEYTGFIEALNFAPENNLIQGFVEEVSDSLEHADTFINYPLLYLIFKKFSMQDKIEKLIDSLMQLSIENGSNIHFVKSLMFISNGYGPEYRDSLSILFLKPKHGFENIILSILNYVNSEESDKFFISNTVNSQEYIDTFFSEPIEASVSDYVSSIHFQILISSMAHIKSGTMHDRLMPVLNKKIHGHLMDLEHGVLSTMIEYIGYHADRSDARNLAAVAIFKDLLRLAVDFSISESWYLRKFAEDLVSKIKSCTDAGAEYLLYKTIACLNKYYDEALVLESVKKLSEKYTNSENNMLTPINNHVNNQFNSILFTNMEEFLCYVYVTDSLEKAKHALANTKKNASMYVCVADDLYYLNTIECSKAVKVLLKSPIETIRDAIKKIMQEDDAYYSGANDLPYQMSDEELEAFNAHIAHTHPDLDLQEQRTRLFDILLSKGQLYESWRYDYSRAMNDIDTYRKMLSAQLNVIFNFIVTISGKKFLGASTEFAKSDSQSLDISYLNKVPGFYTRELEGDLDESIIRFHIGKDNFYKTFKDSLNTNAVVQDSSSYDWVIKSIMFALTNKRDGATDAIHHSQVRGSLKLHLKNIISAEVRRIKRALAVQDNHRHRVKEPDVYFAQIDAQRIGLASSTNMVSGTSLYAVLRTNPGEMMKILSGFSNDDLIKRKFLDDIYRAVSGADTTYEDFSNRCSWNTISTQSKIDKDDYCLRKYSDYIKEWFQNGLPLNDQAILLYAQSENINIYLWERGSKFKSKDLVLRDSYLDPDPMKSSYPSETIHLLCGEKQGDYYVLEYSHTINEQSDIVFADYQKDAAETEILKIINELHADIDKYIDKAPSYKEFLLRLLKKVDTIVKLGSALLERKILVTSALKEHRRIREQRFHGELGDKIKSLPYMMRFELYIDQPYIKSDYYIAECMRDLATDMSRNHATFFMWSTAQIQYYIQHIDLNKNADELIESLYAYRNMTLSYWDEFSKIHNITRTDWESSFEGIIKDNHNPKVPHQLKAAINLSAKYEAKLKNMSAENVSVDLFNINISMNRLINLFSSNNDSGRPSEKTLNTLILRYVQESLFHADILKSSDEESYQYIIKLQVFLQSIKYYYFKDSSEDTFTNALLRILSARISDGDPIHISEILSVCFLYAKQLQGFGFTTEVEFKKAIFSHHFMKSIDKLAKQRLDATILLRDDISLLYANVLAHRSYYLPSQENMEDNLVENFSRVTDRKYTKFSNKEKLEYACASAAYFIKNSDAAQMALQNKNYSLNSFQELYDMLIEAFLQAIPNGADLRKEYEQCIAPALGTKASVRALFNKVADASIKDPLVNKYFIEPISRDLQIVDDPLFPIKMRHQIFKAIIQAVTDAEFENQTPQFLDFLCELIDSASLSLEVKPPGKNASPLFSVNKLHKAHQLFFRENCLHLKKIDGFLKPMLEKLKKSLSLADDSIESLRYIPDAYARRHGWVAENLYAALSAGVPVGRAEQQVRLRELLSQGCFMDHPILFNMLFNKGNLISEADTDEYIAKSYVIETIKSIFLHSHTRDDVGQTPLHKAVEHNLLTIVHWLISKGASVFYENDSGQNASKYLWDYVRNEATKTFDWDNEPEQRAHLLKKYDAMITLLGSMMLHYIFKSDPEGYALYDEIESGLRSYEAILESWFAQWTNFARDPATLAKRERAIEEIKLAIKAYLLDRENILYLQQEMERVLRPIFEATEKNYFFSSRLAGKMTKPMADIKAIIKTYGSKPKSSAQVTKEADPKKNKDVVTAQIEKVSDNLTVQDSKGKEQDSKGKEQVSKGNLVLAFYAKLPKLYIFEQTILANGNCQFTAVEKAFKQVNNNISGDNATVLRAKAVAHILLNQERFEPFLAHDTQGGLAHQDVAYSSMEAYLSSMEKAGTYGDHLSLQALAEILTRPIVVLLPSGHMEEPVCVRIITHAEGARFIMDQALILIFNGHNHYDISIFRGNADFMRLVRKALPVTPDSSATKVQALFRGYRVRKTAQQSGVIPLPIITNTR